MKKTVLTLTLALLLLAGAGKVSAQAATGLTNMNVSAQPTNMPASQAQTNLTAITTPLAVGAQGPSVTALQQLLINKGYLQVSAPTGYYGNLTAAAVTQFQAANNLPQIGQVGPQTLTAVNQALVEMQSGLNPEKPMQQLTPNGCIAGDLYSPTTGQSCTSQQPTIAGCVGTNLYSTLTGQACTIASLNPSMPSMNTGISGSSTGGTTSITLSMNTVPETQGNYGSYTATPSGQFIGTWPNTGEGWINYGTSSTLAGASSTTQVAFSSIANPQQMFTGLISGLQPGTTYYYQACGTASSGSTQICGNINSFTTTGGTLGGTTTSTATGITATGGGISRCAVSIAQNSTFTNQSVQANTNNAEIGSFTITNPCTDSGTMATLNISVAGLAPIATDVTNLTVSINGAQFGSAIPTLQPSGYIYQFNSNAVSIPAGQTVVVNVSANLGSSTTGTIQAGFQPTVLDSVTNQSMLLFVGNGAACPDMTVI